MNHPKRVITIIGTSLLYFGVLPASSHAPNSAPTARVAQGIVVGRKDAGVAAYLGIPYAAPPVGRHRWREPQPPLGWTGVRKAVNYSASCIQQVLPRGRPPWTKEYMVQGRVSEDCLTLNIWTPATIGSRIPVLVWIHGGGFQEGSGSVSIYRGAALAKQGIVVVTINYRLGLFGFFAHPELEREVGRSAASNFGLQDQIAALKWVRDNIAAFGGDPGKVTIAGQSAGSISVHLLIESPPAAGLFTQAIAQSGLPSLIPIRTLIEAEKDGIAFARDQGASSIAKLRAMSIKQLTLAPSTARERQYKFGPVIDGMVVPATPGEMISRGTFNDVPMIVGQTADEGSAFPGYGASDEASYEAYMKRSFGDKAPNFLRYYPAQSDIERSNALKSASRDQGLALIDEWSRAMAGKKKNLTWVYYFNHVEPGEHSYKFGAFHSSEIPYVFSTLDMSRNRSFNAADRLLSLAMSGYWVNFVKQGDPNNAGLPNWQNLMPNSPTVLELAADEIKMRVMMSPEKLATYRSYVASGGRLRMF